MKNWLRTLVPTMLVSLSPVLYADETVAKPEVKVGDRWTYRITDLRLNREIATHEDVVTFVGQGRILTTSTRSADKNEFDSNWTDEWNALALGTGEVYEAPRRFFRFPLRVGDSFETEYKRIAQRNSPAIYTNHAVVSVVGWEQVEVPAGKFRAMKVQVKGTYQRLDVRSSGWFTHTIWYVPEVERWVRYDFENGTPQPFDRNSRVLLEFTLK